VTSSRFTRAFEVVCVLPDRGAVEAGRVWPIDAPASVFDLFNFGPGVLALTGLALFSDGFGRLAIGLLRGGVLTLGGHLIKNPESAALLARPFDCAEVVIFVFGFAAPGVLLE
jgi:hypothetical protein